MREKCHFPLPTPTVLPKRLWELPSKTKNVLRGSEYASNAKGTCAKILDGTGIRTPDLD